MSETLKYKRVQGEGLKRRKLLERGKIMERVKGKGASVGSGKIRLGDRQAEG